MRIRFHKMPQLICVIPIVKKNPSLPTLSKGRVRVSAGWVICRKHFWNWYQNTSMRKQSELQYLQSRQ